MPPASRKGRTRQRNPHYRPRDPRRARYYKASLAAAGVFLALAIVFPFWIDHVKRSRDRADIEASAAVSFVPPPSPAAAPAAPGQTPMGALPYSNMANSQCQSYVQARCNALGIRPGVCGEIEGAAAKVPAGGGMKLCRESVEGRLRDAARYSRPDLDSEGEAAVEPAKPAAGAAPPTVAGPAEEEAGEEEDDGDSRPASDGEEEELSPAQKADNLEKIHMLVEELQRASQNYSTLPAAQRARFMELQKRVEADGGPQLRQLYNVLLKQHGRTAWFDVGGAKLNAGESERVEAGTMEKPAPTTTPEMDEVRQMMNEARREAGMPPGSPPSVGPSSPPTTIEPSAVEAAPARSL